MERSTVFVNTSGTITLDFNRETDKSFRGTAAVTGAKTVALLNDAAAEGFLLSLDVTTDTTLTFPTGFKAETGESRWSSTDLVLTGTGRYVIVGLYDGSSWVIKATPDGGVI